MKPMKKVFFAIALIVLVLLLSGCTSKSGTTSATPGTNSNQTNASNSNNEANTQSANATNGSNTELFAGKIDSLVLTRADLSSEWSFDDGKEVTENSINMVIRKGRTQPVKIQIQKFDSINAAQEAMAAELAPVKEKGGYEEFDVSSIGTGCYGSKIDLTLAEKAKIRCTKKNVWVVVEAQSDQFESESIAKETMQKILQKVN